LAELTPDAAQIMIAKEVSQAIRDGNTTLVSKDASEGMCLIRISRISRTLV
jgi:hypothetical protein